MIIIKSDKLNVLTEVFSPYILLNINGESITSHKSSYKDVKNNLQNTLSFYKNNLCLINAL